MSYWGWGASIVLFAGLWFVGNRARWAFLFTIVGEVAWVVIALNREQYDLAAICAVFGLLALRSLILWGPPPSLETVAAMVAVRMNTEPRDEVVWHWLTCPGATGVKGVSPIHQFDAGEGHKVLEWLDKHWPPLPGPHPEPDCL